MESMICPFMVSISVVYNQAQFRGNSSLWDGFSETRFSSKLSLYIAYLYFETIPDEVLHFVKVYFLMKSKYWRLQLLARYNVLKADHPVRRMNPIDCFVVVRWSRADEIHALYLIFYYPSGALNKILFSGFLLCNHLFLGLKRLFMNVHDFEIRINSIIRFQKPYNVLQL